MTQALVYGATILGIPGDKLPQKPEEKEILINYIKKVHANMSIEDIKLAFDLASEGKTNVDTKLYGANFSASYITGIIKAYKLYKNKLIAQEENKGSKNILQGLVDTFDKMDKTEEGREMLKDIKSIGGNHQREKQERREHIASIELPLENATQRYIREFDKLRRDQDSSDGFAEIEGKKINITEYMQYRLNQEIK